MYMYLPLDVLPTQAISQNLIGHPKCAIGTAQMSIICWTISENESIFFRKWLSRGCRDTHLAVKAWAQVMPCSYLDQLPQPPTSQRKHVGIIWTG